MSERLTTANSPSALHPWLSELNALYALYARAMDYKRRRAELGGRDLVKAWLFVAYAYIRDVWFNLMTASRIFRDPPQEFTVTARLKRYRKTGTIEQRALAGFLCDQVLDAADPDGNHC